jgi:hypothetical protein
MHVRITFFIILLTAFIVREYLDSGASERVWDVASLLLRSSLVVFSVIVAFSILTTVIAYLLSGKSGKIPEVKFTYTGNNQVICELVCDKLTVPLVGTVKAELSFDKQYEAVILLKKTKGKGSGKKELTLPDIKNYNLDSVTLLFQDFFRIFSIAKVFSHKESVLVLPVSEGDISVPKAPFTFDNDEIRTDTVHKKEGELLHFKHFEASDDIRRIVWPVYARTKELIVRTVEMHNMYASKIDMYASFCNSYQNLLEKSISDTFLNYYKTDVWEVYKSFKKDNEVHFVPDQKSKIAIDYQHEVSAQISGMAWHSNKIEEYFGNNKVSITCISSLIPSQDVEKVLDHFGANTIVVFVSLKSTIAKISISDILREIFTIPEEKKINWKWWFSMNRKKVLNNDKAVRNALISRKLNYIEL